MSLPFAQSYIGKLRAKVGNDLIFMPACRAVIENERGELLLVRRRDNGQWALPGGLPEVGESASECMVREVLEETGLHLEHYICFGLSTNPVAELHTYPNGDRVHGYAILFYANRFQGQAHVADSESLEVRFFSEAERPGREVFMTPDWTTLQQFAQFKRNGEFILA